MPDFNRNVRRARTEFERALPEPYIRDDRAGRSGEPIGLDLFETEHTIDRHDFVARTIQNLEAHAQNRVMPECLSRSLISVTLATLLPRDCWRQTTRTVSSAWRRAGVSSPRKRGSTLENTAWSRNVGAAPGAYEFTPP